MPNEIARSALFSVRNHRTPREPHMKAPIFAVGDAVTITFTGVELRAEDDELVWQQVLEYAKRFPLGTWVEFTVRQLCLDLGWPDNGRYYDKVHACLLRLKATAIEIQCRRLGSSSGKAVSLVDQYEWQDRAGSTLRRRRVLLHPLMQRLFGGKHYTRIEWEKYRKLSPIARRLYDYCASHRDPYPLRFETVQKMCNSRAAGKKWPELVERASDELAAVGLAEVRVDKDAGLIRFTRNQQWFDT